MKTPVQNYITNLFINTNCSELSSTLSYVELYNVNATNHSITILRTEYFINTLAKHVMHLEFRALAVVLATNLRARCHGGRVNSRERDVSRPIIA